MEEIHANLVAEKIGEWAGIPILNTMLMAWVVILVLTILALALRRRLMLMPNKIQLLFEMLLAYIMEFIETTLESRALARRYFPFLTTIFLFIFTANMLEFIPGVGSIGLIAEEAHEVARHSGGFTPLLRSMNTDLNVTLALSIIAFFTIEISGIIAVGLFRYLGRFFNFHSPIGFFIGIIEFVSEFIRLISFSFRLFGNIFAGEVLLSVITYFVPFIIPVPFMAFELFVGFMQAAIFALLTLFFIKLAISEQVH